MLSGSVYLHAETTAPPGTATLPGDVQGITMDPLLTPGKVAPLFPDAHLLQPEAIEMTDVMADDTITASVGHEKVFAKEPSETSVYPEKINTFPVIARPYGALRADIELRKTFMQTAGFEAVLSPSPSNLIQDFPMLSELGSRVYPERSTLAPLDPPLPDRRPTSISLITPHFEYWWRYVFSSNLISTHNASPYNIDSIFNLLATLLALVYMRRYASRLGFFHFAFIGDSATISKENLVHQPPGALPRSRRTRALEVAPLAKEPQPMPSQDNAQGSRPSLEKSLTPVEPPAEHREFLKKHPEFRASYITAMTGTYRRHIGKFAPSLETAYQHLQECKSCRTAFKRSKEHIDEYFSKKKV
jgi:hypothetical protein